MKFLVTMKRNKISWGSVLLGYGSIGVGFSWGWVYSEFGAFDGGLVGGIDGGNNCGLDGGLDGGLYIGLDVCLNAGLDVGLDIGIDGGLDGGLEGNLNSGMNGGHDGVLHNGISSLQYMFDKDQISRSLRTGQ